MVEVTAQMVMELRQKTGAKMMDAKHALVEAAGDFDKAVELLREKGQAEATKRTHRVAAEGTITTTHSADRGAAAMVEVNCETDFVAKTDQFRKLVGELAAWSLGQVDGEITPDGLPETQRAAVHAAVSSTGENVQFRRGMVFCAQHGVVESYIHLGGKIGVLVQVDGATNDAVRALAKDLAMQVAAASPEYLTREDVPPATIEREQEIYRTQARNEGKPEQIVDRIAAGRLEKFFKDNCLVEQPYIKDPDRQVKALVAEVATAVGVELTIARFTRYQLGQ